VRLQFLGSGDAFGSGGRLQTCLALDTGEGLLLLDCGATSLVAMRRAGVDPGDVGWVALSHLHGDHFGGVPFLILDGQFRRRARPLVIAGPPTVGTRLHAAMEVLFPGSTAVERRFATEIVELQPEAPAPLGPARVLAFPVIHASGAPSYALRVECGGRVVTYSGDTEWTDALRAAARGADLLVCEAYTFDRKLRYHLDYATLRAEAASLGCRRLVLTHMGPEMLARAGEADHERADDGLVIELS
jgi:ribonuclease BN (tRNA processing enzyme)